MTTATRTMELWTVYFNPSDFPGLYVLRRFSLFEDGTSCPDDGCAIAQTLEGVRDHIPAGCVRMMRHQYDDPAIIEVWL
jgi:hypothetical protein